VNNLISRILLILSYGSLTACSSSASNASNSAVASDSSNSSIVEWTNSGDGDQGSFFVRTTVSGDGKVSFDDNLAANFTLDARSLQSIMGKIRGLSGNLKSKKVAHIPGETALSQNLLTYKAQIKSGSFVIFETVESQADFGNEGLTETTRKDVDSSGSTAGVDALVATLAKINNADVTPGDLEGRPDAKELCRGACELNANLRACEVRLGCAN